MELAGVWSELAKWHYEGTLVRVVDGDTIRISAEQYADQRREFVVRLLGVDTPELRSKDAAEKERAVAARNFTMRFLIDSAGTMKRVQLRLTGRQDVYGRHLGWVMVDGEDLSEALIKAGLGEGKELVMHINRLTEEGSNAHG